MIDAVAKNGMLGVCCFRAAKLTTNLYILIELGNIFVHVKKNSLCSSPSLLASASKLEIHNAR